MNQQVFPKEYIYYNYEPELKQYVRNAVSQYFKDIYIELDDLLSYVKDLRSEKLYNLIQNLNIPITQSYVDIFYQMSVLYLIDHIKQQKMDEQKYIDPVNITYDNLKAITPYGKYDCSWFPIGLYVFPRILTETIANRIAKLVHYLLADNTQSAIRFSLTRQDEIYGDMCPNVLYCIYKSIYESLNEKFIILFEKKKLLITNTISFSMNKIDVLTEEVFFIFTRHATAYIGKNKLILPTGSILVLNKEALGNTIKISALENSTVLIFY